MRQLGCIRRVCGLWIPTFSLEGAIVRNCESGPTEEAWPALTYLTFSFFLQRGKRFLEKRQSWFLVTTGKNITPSPGCEPLFPMEILTCSTVAYCKIWWNVHKNRASGLRFIFATKSVCLHFWLSDGCSSKGERLPQREKRILGKM